MKMKKVICVAIAFFALIALSPVQVQAKKKVKAGGTRVLEFLPSKKKAKYKSRPEIEVTDESADSLLEKGYVKIGVVNAKHVVRSCPPPDPEATCEEIGQKTDTMAEIRREAAKRGGDLLVLMSDRVMTHEPSAGRFCKAFGSAASWQYVYNWSSGGTQLVLGSQKTCVEYGEYLYMQDVETSVGAVWRHEPELARQSRRERDFVAAAGQGDIEKVKALLTGGLDINRATNSEGSLALTTAALAGDEDMVRLLISRGADVNAMDTRSPLSQAVSGGHLEIVRLLLAEGADVDATYGALERRALFEAARVGDVEILEELLKSTSIVNPVDNQWHTPLMIAAMEGNTKAVEVLLEHGARINNWMNAKRFGFDAGWTALHYAAVFSLSPETVRVLLLNGADALWPDASGSTPLDWAPFSPNMVNEMAVDLGIKPKERQDAEHALRRIHMLLEGHAKGFSGFVDPSGRLVIDPKFRSASRFSEGLAPVKEWYTWGYIDKTGKWIIEPRFDEVWGGFHEGFAAVAVGDDGWGFIDRSGEFVVEPQFWLPPGSFQSGLASVSKFLYTTDDQSGKPAASSRSGFIDPSGQYVIPPRFKSADSFSEERAFVRLEADGKYGAIDRSGRLVIEPQFDELPSSYSEGLAAVKVKGKWGYMDKSGKMIIPPKYSNAMSFAEGAAAVVDGKWGYIDRTGATIIDFQFREVASFSEGLAPVNFVKDRWGFIDKTGKIVIDLQFEGAHGFSEGMAAVSLGGKWGFIDRAGSFLIEPRFHFAFIMSEGMAQVIVKGDDYVAFLDSIP